MIVKAMKFGSLWKIHRFNNGKNDIILTTNINNVILYVTVHELKPNKKTMNTSQASSFKVLHQAKLKLRFLSIQLDELSYYPFKSAHVWIHIVSFWGPNFIWTTEKENSTRQYVSIWAPGFGSINCHQGGPCQKTATSLHKQESSLKKGSFTLFKLMVAHFLLHPAIVQEIVERVYD